MQGNILLWTGWQNPRRAGLHQPALISDFRAVALRNCVAAVVTRVPCIVDNPSATGRRWQRRHELAGY